MRAPTNLKENYQLRRKELANAIRALAMDAVQKAALEKARTVTDKPSLVILATN